MRPLDLAGLNSLTQRGVVAVLKPLPHPLQDVNDGYSQSLGHAESRLPYNSADNDLGDPKSASLQDCTDCHEDGADIETFPAPDLFANDEDIDSTSEAANSDQQPN